MEWRGMDVGCRGDDVFWVLEEVRVFVLDLSFEEVRGLELF